MEKRIKVEEENLKEIFSNLQDRGLTLDEITEEIGTEFRNHLYKNTTLSQESFQNLLNLYDKEIDHQEIFFINGQGASEQIRLRKNENLAELVGIILGDGHIDKHSRDRGDRYISSYYVSVTLHEDEVEMIRRVKVLLSAALGRQAKIENVKTSKAVNIKIYGKEIVEALELIGLQAGNKVEKQIEVPGWVKEDKRFMKACLRGLIDTDGSVYERTEGETIVYFKNRSEPLLKDFCEMCDIINIRTSRAGKYARQVAAQAEVSKFINEVDPIKAQIFGSDSDSS